MKEIKLGSLLSINSNSIKNRQLKNQGFPISCVFIDENKRIITNKVNRKNKNKESAIRKSDHKNHAEYLCLQRLLRKEQTNQPRNIMVIMTVPPCSNCLNKMQKLDHIKWEIYYLADEIGKKCMKEYIKEFVKLGHTVKKLYSKDWSLKTKLKYWFCVNKVIGAFKWHTHTNEKFLKNKESIIKKHIQKIKSDLKELGFPKNIQSIRKIEVFLGKVILKEESS